MPRAATKRTPQPSGSLKQAHLTGVLTQLDRNYEMAAMMRTIHKEGLAQGLAVIQELHAAREAIDERCRGAELRAEQMEHRCRGAEMRAEQLERRLRDLIPALGLANVGSDGPTAAELSALWCQVASSMDEKALSIELKGSRWEMPKHPTHELPTVPSLPPQLSLTQQAPQALLPAPARLLCHPDQPPQVHLTRPDFLHAGHQLQQPHRPQQQLQQAEPLRQPQQTPQRIRSFLSEGRDTVHTGAQVQAATPTVKQRASREQLQPEGMDRAERAGRPVHRVHREATSPEFSPGSVSRRIAELEEQAASSIRTRGRGDGCTSPKCRSPNHSPSGLRSPIGCVRSPIGGFRSIHDGNTGPGKEADQVTHVPSWAHLHGGSATGSSSDLRWQANSSSYRPHATTSGTVPRSGTPQSGRARGTDRQAHGARAQSSAPQPRGSTQCGNRPRGRVPQSSSSACSLTSKPAPSSNSVVRERIKALQAKGLTAAATGPRRWSPPDAILGGNCDSDEPSRG